MSAARALRRRASAAERDAWDALRMPRGEGVHVRRQHAAGRYFVDFAVARARLAIELDGPLHTKFGNEERDAERQRYIEKMGWRVVRFPSNVTRDALLDGVRAALAELKRDAHRSPSPGGEGERGRGEAQALADESAAKRAKRRGAEPLFEEALQRSTRANRKLRSRKRDVC